MKILKKFSKRLGMILSKTMTMRLQIAQHVQANVMATKKGR